MQVCNLVGHFLLQQPQISFEETVQKHIALKTEQSLFYFVCHATKDDRRTASTALQSLIVAASANTVSVSSSTTVCSTTVSSCASVSIAVSCKMCSCSLLACTILHTLALGGHGRCQVSLSLTSLSSLCLCSLNLSLTSSLGAGVGLLSTLQGSGGLCSGLCGDLGLGGADAELLSSAGSNGLGLSSTPGTTGLLQLVDEAQRLRAQLSTTQIVSAETQGTCCRLI